MIGSFKHRPLLSLGKGPAEEEEDIASELLTFGDESDVIFQLIKTLLKIPV